MYKKHDKYIQAVADLYEQENKENAESNHNIKSSALKKFYKTCNFL